MKRRADSGDNAFDVLMKKKTRTRTSSAHKSRFVACPAGCGTHIPEHQVNNHLDCCLAAASSLNKTEGSTSSHAIQSEQDTTDVTIIGDAATKQDVSAVELDSKVAPAPEEQPENSQEQQTIDSSSAATISPEAGPNIFSLMMKQSHRVFATPKPVRQHFHLHSNCHLSWTTDADDVAAHAKNNVEKTMWSAQVSLKASRMLYGDSSKINIDTPQPRDVDLTISSSIPSSLVTAPTRLVKRHSRLSVPVLKSVLQKSIRRRRPLPAVRVAMELMDKAFGELLRRLPIIVLEDSTLHPDLPLLVWIMVAESKDYVVPRQLITRVLCIIYEMASCPWTDFIGDDECTNTQSQGGNDAIHLSSPSPWLKDTAAANGGDSEVLLRSILLRAQYGGMAGDMKMLHGYVRFWRRRLLEGIVPTNISKRLHPTSTSSPPPKVNWADVPTMVHARSKVQGLSHITPLMQKGLERLSLNDICLAGVDFHCSAVLDEIIAGDGEKHIWEGLCAIVVRAELGPVPTTEDKRRSYLMQTMKRCMWTFSSGVNYRQSLASSEASNDSSRKDTALKSFWDKHLAARVERYTKKYVADRLAR